jgi:CheY-like chemotaxis protein
MNLNLPQGNTYAEFFGLTDEDKELIAKLTDPIPFNEEKRISVLRQTKLLDSDMQEPTFDRFTTLGQRLFGFPICAISLVDAGRCWYKSKTGMTDVQWPRGQSFCTYAILPESPDVFVIEDARANALYSTFWQVATPPFVRFYAAAALVVEGVRIGTLCLADVQPHPFSMRDRMNLLDLGNAVAEVIAQRRKNYLNANQERATMMLTMMHGLRTPLFAVDIGMNVLNSERPTINEALVRTDPTQSNAHLFASTVDDIDSSVKKLKMAVESTVVLGKALAVTTVSQAKPNTTAELSTKSVNTLMTNSVVLDVDTVLNQMKLISTLIGKRTIEWECDTLRDSLIGSLVNTTECNAVRSFPDALNFVLLAVLTHIVTYDVSGEPIQVKISSTQCNAGSRMCVDLTKADDNDECVVCNHSSSTVQLSHGSIIMTVSSKAIISPLAGTAGVCEEALSFASNLTLAPAINQVMDAIGGRYSSFQQRVTQPPVDVYMCQIPYVACFCEEVAKQQKANEAVDAVAPMVVSESAACPESSGEGEGESKQSNDGECAISLKKAKLCGACDPESPNVEEVRGKIPSLQIAQNLPAAPPADAAHASPAVGAVAALIESARKDAGVPTIRVRSPGPGVPGSTAARRESGSVPPLMTQQLRVLVVDDSLMIQKMLRKWLEHANCIVTCAPNGKLGLNLMMSNEFDLVLMDFLMVSCSSCKNFVIILRVCLYSL